jgi:DNA-binding NarL/FixJ family response regulator
MTMNEFLSPLTYPHCPVIRVLLVDDHAMVRAAIGQTLRACPDFEVVAEASDGVGAILAAREHRPDVVVMDVSMPGLRGVEATRRITGSLPETKVIGLSLHPRELMADAMLAAGAAAYLDKSCAGDELCAAIRDVFGVATAPAR